MRTLGALATLSGVLLLAFAASSDEATETARLNGLVLDRFREAQARVMRVADPLRIAAAPFCGEEVVAVIGIYVATRYTFVDMIPGQFAFEKALNASAVDRFALGRRPRILVTVPGLPAERAGLRPGDLVIRVGGKKPGRFVQLDSLRLDGEAPIPVTLERDGQELELELERVGGCAPPGRYMFGTEINAFATHFGSNTGIYVYGGMLDFFESDDQLAVILGHELAHMIQKHTQNPRASRDTEADADYLGLYLAARAGFDISVAMDVWDAFTLTNPYSTIDWGHYAHPMTPSRSVMVESTVAEIASKLASGEPLDPRPDP
jgi:hypothetical protein